MSKMKLLRPVAIAVSAALAGGVSVTANADTGPFAMAGLSSGYMLASGTEGAGGEKAAEAEGKCGEGKCGEAMKANEAEGKCGEDMKAHHAEGKCGEDMKAHHAEGKCGEDMKAHHAEGKCGEGKCGGEKADKAEGKCGEGKCGGEKADKAEGKCGGVTEYRIGEDVEETLRRADQAMYDAKNGGRNQIECAGELGSTHVPSDFGSQVVVGLFGKGKAVPAKK